MSRTHLELRLVLPSDRSTITLRFANGDDRVLRCVDQVEYTPGSYFNEGSGAVTMLGGEVRVTLWDGSVQEFEHVRRVRLGKPGHGVGA